MSQLTSLITRQLDSMQKIPCNRKNFPYYTEEDRWISIGESGQDDWVAGFWAGLLWMTVETKEARKDTAISVTNEIRARSDRNFNTGFRILYSHGAAEQYTEKTNSRGHLDMAKETLLNCYRSRAGLICHGPDAGPWISATDSMMNLLLLLWHLRRENQDPYLKNIVIKHIETLLKLFLRSDGGIHHLAKLNTDDGTIAGFQNPQGVEGGCWSRGLAWSVYSLLLCGVIFDRREWIESAERLLCYHDNYSRNGVPPYDYQLYPNSKPPTDTSATAILVSGMLLYDTLSGQPEFRQRAHKYLDHLLTHYIRNKPGLLGGASYHVPATRGTEGATIWGDFYLLEAIWLRERETFPPHLRWLEPLQTD